MHLLTFDPFRTLGCPSVHYIKPARLMDHIGQIERAEVVLFPDYADINLLCFALNKAIFPSVSSYVLGFDKIEMTRAFQSCFPQHVPVTIMLPNGPDGRASILDRMEFPFVAKLPRGSRGEGVFRIQSSQDWDHYCSMTSMLYVQEQLDIDRDLRIVWIGDRIIYSYWRVGAPGVFHNNLAHGGTIDPENVPPAALRLVEKIARQFRIDYAGFDVAMVGGHPYIFEFNRLFGLEGVNQAGINTGEMIYDYLLRRPAQAHA